MNTYSELIGTLTRYPLDSTVLFKGKKIGTVIGYKRANGNGRLQIIFKHYKHLALGRESLFDTRSRNYSCEPKE